MALQSHSGSAAPELYLLRNRNGLEARVSNYGATLVSLCVPDRAGTLDDVVLGFDTLARYQEEHPYFGCVVGRYANRIAAGQFTLGSRRFALRTNDGVNHLHGGPRGFHRVLWHTAGVEADGTALTLCYASRDGEEGYPGNLEVEVRYALTDADELRLEYRAQTDAPTIVNLTNHSYFNLAGTGTILDHVLRVVASAYLPVDATRIPLGSLAPVAGTPFDFRTARPIGSHIGDPDPQLEIGPGYDHTWVLDKEPGEMSLAAELADPLSGRRMSVYTTQPGLQIYSGNFLDATLHGKRDIAYPRHGGVCLETHHFPDSPNQPAFPSTLLEPGALFHEVTVYRFERA